MEAQTLCTCCFSHLDHSGQVSLGLLSSQDGEARVSVPRGWGAVPPWPGALTGSDRCGRGLSLSYVPPQDEGHPSCALSPRVLGHWWLTSLDRSSKDQNQ